MTDWAMLQDGYGEATAIPALIEALVDAPSPELWSDLWGHLCHQGTVYSASFAAVPLLYQTISRMAPTDRRGALMLVAAIMASIDRHGGATPDEAALSLLPDLLHMTEAAMGESDVDEEEFSYLLQAALALRGDAIWHGLLDGMARDEFDGLCRVCQVSMYILPQNEGYAAVRHRDALNPAAARNPVMPTSPDSLPRVGSWLHAQAMRHEKRKTANALTHIFGRVACPGCSTSISVAEAIVRATLPILTDEDD